VPDHQSISEPKPADAELRFQYWSSPSASKHRVETEHQSGSSALSQHRDHHDDSNQTNDRKQGDSQLPGDRGEQGVGSPVARSQIRESGASISRLSEATSNNDDRVLADVGSSVQPSVQPSSSQDRIRLQHSSGRRPCSGTDVGENHRPVEDGVREPPRKRYKINTPDPAVGETAPKRQANYRASSQSRRAQRPTTRRATRHQSQRRKPRPRSSGVASTTQQAQRKFCNVEHILDLQVWYLVQWEGYGPEHNSWEPVEHFDECPELLSQFHRRTGLVTTTQTPCLSQLKIPKPHSAGMASTTKKGQREYFNVEHVLDFQVRYLVKWKGYGHEDNTWEPVGHFDQCPRLLQQFHGETGSVGNESAAPFSSVG
jgi:hypothetical protein